MAILGIFWLHCAGSIKELTLKSNGRRWLSRVSVSSSSGPSGLSKELEHKTEEEKENCQANEKPNNGGYGRLSKGTRRICNQMNIDNDQLFLELNIKHFPSDVCMYISYIILLSN